MGDPKGFLKIKRKVSEHRPVEERIKDYDEVPLVRDEAHTEEQTSRCMDCGTPFCHWGCPVGNLIPEWNDMVFHKKWDRAYELLQYTNNFPEITGRICPAPCEYACVLGINDEPVTIRENERDIIEYAFRKGMVVPHPPKQRTDKKVAVIGSGPAGLAAADQLNKAGHNVTLFEKDDKVGGILRYGIPDFKLNKSIIDRRINILKEEGIEFITNTNVGVDFSASKLKNEFDAICLTGGSREPRDLKIEGRELNGIYFAMDFLTQTNRIAAGESIDDNKMINARGKKVVVIGGGDTGADCVGTAHRQGAIKVIQIEVMPKPPEKRTEDFPWPTYPRLLKVSTSYEEGGERYWSVLTKKIIGENGNVKKLLCVKVDFSEKDEHGKPIMKEIPNTEFEIEADMVIIAVGFLYPIHTGLLEKLGVEFDNRGNVKCDSNYMTSVKKVFSAGDMRRGQSLVVWAISEGRKAAYSINKYLGGKEGIIPIM